MKQACQNPDVQRRGPMGASVYIAGGWGAGLRHIHAPTPSRPSRHHRAARWVGSRTLTSGGRRRGSTLLGGPCRWLSAAASPPASLAARGALCGSSPGPKPPASAPGGHAGERMSQRDTLVHLFAGGYGPGGARRLRPRGWAEAEGGGLRLGREWGEGRWSAGCGDAALAGRVGRMKPGKIEVWGLRRWSEPGAWSLGLRRGGRGWGQHGSLGPRLTQDSSGFLAGVRGAGPRVECSCRPHVGYWEGKGRTGWEVWRPRTKWAPGPPPPSLLAVRATGSPQVAGAPSPTPASDFWALLCRGGS